MLWTLAQAVSVLFSALCVTLVSLFLVLVCIPRLHAPVRAWLRPLAVHHVERGLDIVVAAQRYQSPWLTSLFTKSSHSVSVSFYASFLPMLIWLGLPELGRNLVCLMTMSLYVGNAIKDLVCAPRPLAVSYGREKLKFLGASDEEVQLNAKEYGLPSSHTLNTLALNYMFVWYLYDRQLISTATAGLLYCLVALWVVWIAASRLYLGLHTPIDILAGAVAGLTVLVCFIAIEGYLSRWVLAGPQVALHAALVSLVLLRLHPRPLAHTPSYEFTVSFMGAMFGLMTGAACVGPKGSLVAGVQLAQVWAPSNRVAGSRLLWVARRLAAGFACVVTMKEVSRAVLLEVLPLLYRFFPLAVRRLWQPPVHDLYKAQQQQTQQQQADSPQQGVRRSPRLKQQQQEQQQPNGTHDANAAAAAGVAAKAVVACDPRLAELPHNAKGIPWDVDVTSRFFAYAAIGVAVSGVAPNLFEALGW